MVAISAEALRLMSIYTPEELAKLVQLGPDGSEPVTPPELTYQERVALNRARIAEIDRQQAAQADDGPVRPSEAETRGYARARAPVRSGAPRAREDNVPASPLWLKDHFKGLYRIGPLWTVREAKAGYPRHVWRAAVAGVLSMDRQEFRCVEWAIARFARAIADGEADDPRSRNYQAWPNWPKPLYEFALVALPEKFGEQPARPNDGTGISLTSLFPR